MLDSDTKRRIDRLRDILVGKIPSPESQVEQITTGLVYKFMHDMDEESVESNGKASFFTGEFEKYSWQNLFDPKLGGAERVQLYSDAIEAMHTNPTALALFREIFKNSFLPFKDPSTLNMFLKEINEFHYSHSEKLGDAFEYLLSFMGSQGDAGQFRTPRHIIDFMVALVNPQKNETILDPACGTAGFLISSFKHILTQNTNKKLGDALTAKQRKKIGENLVGYDISPDMTRISLVNMYLHNFANPPIHEYDTLSSEDRWNEYYDVILANPPFFSPKGGIQPHSRFGVQSTRAEVLFVDYIMAHLKPNGRAGIIVPEGIIFQTGKAYKALRKKLVEDCLVGVVSLPAGVFQPYSGVKTSILILDKQRNQKSDSIFFAKVENDGFSLGAQRTPIDKNDLPTILELVKKQQTEANNFVSASKNTIAQKSFTLNFNQYSASIDTNSDFDFVSIGSLFDEIRNGKNVSQQDEVGRYRVSRIQSISAGVFNKEKTKWTNDNVKDTDFLKSEDILFSHINSIEHIGKTAPFTEVEDIVHGANLLRLRTANPDIIPRFALSIFKSKEFLDLARSQANQAVNQASINTQTLKAIEIPLPPIEVQQEIVAELEGYQKIIDGCRQVVENYKPTIDIDPAWEMVALGEVAELRRGTSITKKQVKEGEIPVIAGGQKPAYFHNQSNRLADSITVSSSGAYAGFVSFHATPIFASDCFTIISNADGFNQKFLFHLLKSRQKQIYEMQTGAGQPHVYAKDFDDFEIPLPPIEVQQEIAAELNENQKIIDGNKQLIETYTQKIQDRISKIWGE